MIEKDELNLKKVTRKREREMTSKNTNFEEELNKSLTQEEKDLLH